MAVSARVLCVMAAALLAGTVEASVTARHLSGLRPVLKEPRFSPRGRSRESLCRIQDNNFAVDGQLPHQALVRSDLKYVSAGSLVAPAAVLTSATTVVGYEKWLVRLGTIHLEKQDPSAWSITSTWAMVHPGYNTTFFTNDVAVIILPRKAPLGNNIKPVLLPSDKEADETFAGYSALVSGWGYPPNSSAVSSVLIFTEVTVVPNAICKKYYSPGFITEGSMCAANENKAIENGDSGAPLVIKTPNGYKQIGVASFWSRVVVSATVPGGYIRVTAILDWIRSLASNVVH